MATCRRDINDIFCRKKVEQLEVSNFHSGLKLFFEMGAILKRNTT